MTKAGPRYSHLW